MGREQFFEQMVLGPLDIHIQKNEVGSLSHTIQKNYSKWIIDQTIRAKTIKLLEKNIGVYIYDLQLGKAFLIMTPNAQVRKNKSIGLYEN